MSQTGWVKPDFGSGYLNKQLTRKQTGSNTKLCEPNRKKNGSGFSEIEQNSMIVPLNSNELVVNKKKIAELKQWLDQAFSSAQQRSQFLLITGPPGCGKQQTLSVLCKEMYIEILCWQEPIKHFGVDEWDQKGKYGSSYGKDDTGVYCKQTDQNFFEHLEEFYERANRYGTLQIRDKGSTDASINKKLLLLKDFPPMIFKNLDRWHNLLLKYSLKGKTPAVFIITDGNSYNSMQLKLFPHHLQEKIAMSIINFSGLAKSFLVKALQRFVQKQQKSISLEVIEGIVETCNGDLRSALNAINWIGQSEYVATNKPPPHSKKRKLAVEQKKSFEGNYIRDGSLDFMHAVGKVLHSKRLITADQICDLPPHLENELRMPLKENIDELTNKIGETPPKILLYLHQNYPLFFNRIEDVSKAVGYLSSADSFCNQFHQGNKETFEECALLTGVRGLMHSNTSVSGSKWCPIKKPDYYAIHQKQQDLLKEVQEFWPSHTSGSHFFSETLPFIRHILPGQKISQTYSASGASGYFVEPNQLKSAISTNNMMDTISSTKEDEDVIIEEFDD